MCYLLVVLLCLPVRLYCIVLKYRVICSLYRVNELVLYLLFYFLKTASGFNGRCSDELILPTSNLDVA